MPTALTATGLFDHAILGFDDRRLYRGWQDSHRHAVLPSG
jgi:hypothetical protein